VRARIAGAFVFEVVRQRGTWTPSADEFAARMSTR
jgi:hypothetical protein